jgi:toxin ParE1/3/4
MPSRRLPIALSPEADEDLIEIWGYLAREASDQVADRQLHEIETVCATLRDWPYSGRKRDELLAGMRSVSVRPYAAFYRVRDDAIEIVRVLHGRRDIASIFSGSSDIKNPFDTNDDR